jgi:hypothetical protein
MMHMVLVPGKTGAGAGENKEFKMILMFTFYFAKSMANIGADKDIIDYLNTTYVLKCLNHYR